MFGERLGRRNCIMLGCIVLSIGAALQASANTIAHMIVGRIVAGLGNGMNTSTIPVWHSELMQAKKRGKGVIYTYHISRILLTYIVAGNRVGYQHLRGHDRLLGRLRIQLCQQ
jgi:MFS family permease